VTCGKKRLNWSLGAWLDGGRPEGSWGSKVSEGVVNFRTEKLRKFFGWVGGGRGKRR
jgi:hypothetical protein